MKKIIVACDRAGIEMKNFLIGQLNTVYEFIDFGVNTQDPVDYPDYAQIVAKAILDKKGDLGILICGTGIGMSIAANRFRGIRAGLCHNPLEARLTREHNDANILCLGARMIGNELALENVKVFCETEFAGGRHLNRIIKIDAL
jgi:ribose 5-phosphate isomerase B